MAGMAECCADLTEGTVHCKECSVVNMPPAAEWWDSDSVHTQAMLALGCSQPMPDHSGITTAWLFLPNGECFKGASFTL